MVLRLSTEHYEEVRAVTVLVVILASGLEYSILTGSVLLVLLDMATDNKQILRMLINYPKKFRPEPIEEQEKRLYHYAFTSRVI